MLRYLEYAREAMEALWHNRARSILTMLGMIIGTSAVVAVFGISQAASSGISATIASFGVPGVFVQVDNSQNYPARAQIQYRDIASIAAQTEGLLAYIEPQWQQSLKVRYGTTTGVETINSFGPYAPADGVPMQAGRKIDQEDLDSAAKVCTLTADLATKYFGAAPAVGNYISINGDRFEVVGVYSPLNGSLFSSLGSGNVFIPFSTYHNMFPGPVDSIVFYSASGVSDDAAIASVRKALQHIHGPQALYIMQSGASAIGSFQKVLNIVAAGLSAIGAVALVVAGIGIMNIMLVSVIERTREIGIRKSIGASRRDIIWQFLMEATILSLLGGGTGLGIGLLATIGAAMLISSKLGAAIIPYLMLVSLAIAFSIGIGMAFGLYPAIRASKLDPIEALRS